MQKNLTTTKTILLAFLLVLLVCSLTITLTLTYQQQVAQASQPVTSVDELTSDSSSDDYDVMPIAVNTWTVADDDSIRQAFTTQAQNGDTIQLTKDINLTDRLLLNKSVELTLDLNGKTLTGISTACVIQLGSGATLNLVDKSSSKSGIITGGNGGIIVGSDCKLNMFGGEITNNTTLNIGGGGVRLSGGTFIMNDGVISNNYSATGGGGVMLVSTSTFVMNGGTILNNRAPNIGGGVHMNNESNVFIMNGGLITNNSTPTNAGGVNVSATDSFTMSGTAAITDNQASYGGGVYNTGTFSMSDSATISGNVASKFGGGVYVNANFTMSGGTISGNMSADCGGGVYVAGLGTFYMSDSALITGNLSNTMSGNGGGGVHVSNGIFTMDGGTISNNVSNGDLGGGGVYVTGAGKLSDSPNFIMNNGQIIGNITYGSVGGGGIYNTNYAIFEMNNGEISNNFASSKGGGIYQANNQSIFRMYGGTITENTASEAGGLALGAGSLTLSGTVIIKDNCVLSGGASNLHLYDHTVTLSTLSERAEIYVTNTVTPFAFAYSVTTDVLQYFHADNTTQCIGYSDGNLVLGTHNPIWDTSNDSTHEQMCANCGVTENSGSHQYTYVADSGANTHHQVCSDCGKALSSVAHIVTIATKTDSSNHTGYCDDCGAKVIETHTWDEKNLKSDLNGHWYACTVCGEKQDGGTTHDWNEMKWQAENGNHFKKCSDCDQTNYVDKHILEHTKAVKATCQEYGYKEYYYCSTCKNYFTDESGQSIIEDFEQWHDRTGQNGGKTAIDNSAHNWNTEYNSNVSGHWHECLNEGCKERKENPIQPHNYNETYYDDGKGNHYQECVDCTYQTIPEEHTVTSWISKGSETHQGQCETCQLTVVASHDWETETKTFDDYGHWYKCKSSDCTAKNDYQAHRVTTWAKLDSDSHKGDCTDCDKKDITATHTLGELKKDEENNYYQKCTANCGYKIEYEVDDVHVHNYVWKHDSYSHWEECSDETCRALKDDPTPHTFGSWSMTLDGKHSHTCDNVNCNYTLTEEHQYTSENLLTNETSHWKECKVCGNKESDTHSFGSWTDNLDGRHYKECNICNYKAYEIHTFSTWQIADNTYHTRTCDDCNKVETAEHTLGKLLQDEDGFYHKCSAEGCTYETERQAMEESHVHSWTEEYQTDETNHWKECTTCGARKDVQKHSVDGWTVKDAITHTGQCSVCSKEVTQGHELNQDGECTNCDYVLTNIPDCIHVVTTGTSNGTETHTGVCEICGQTVSVSHLWSEDYVTDDNGHWYECTVCHDRKNYEQHQFEFTTDGEHTHSGSCSVCGKHFEKEHTWLFGFCTECPDQLKNYSEADIGIAATAIVAQLFALIAVAAIISRRIKR